MRRSVQFPMGKRVAGAWQMLSLRSKLFMQSAIVSAVVLIFACSILVLFDQYRQRQVLDSSLMVMGQVLAENSAAAVMFEDLDAAKSTLSRLGTNRSVQAACLYRVDAGVWKLLAQYRREKTALLICPPEGSKTMGITDGRILVENQSHFLSRVLVWDGQRIGEIVLSADLSEQETRLQEYSAMALVVVLIAMVLSVFLSWPFVRMILQPLLNLHETAVDIAKSENYRLRAPKVNQDEIGGVVDAFNGMLDIIEHGNSILRENEERFRLLSEAAAFGVFQLDVQGAVVYCNQQLCYITGLTREQILQKGLLLAVHPDDEEGFICLMKKTLGKRISQQIEGRILHQDGRVAWVSVRLAPIHDHAGALLGFMGAVSDISDIKAVHDQLEQMAFYDPLTKLANRRLFRIQLEKSLLACHRREKGLAVLLLDIDLFKHVNDSLGHDIGDELLVEVAQRLQHCVRVTDTVGRLGGDEFVVLLENTDSIPLVSRIAKSIQATFDKPFLVSGHTLAITASIGIVTAPRDGISEKQLLKNADLALYQCKEAGRNTFCFFTQDMNAQLEHYLGIEKDLRNAIDRHEFVLHYQPQIDLHTNRLKGFEALLRWRHPQRGMVSPLDFIPVAEQTGLIIPIGKLVLREAVMQFMSMRNRNVIDDDVVIAVNLSAKQFADKELVNDIEDLIAESGISPHNLELELTESVLMENINTASDMLHYLRNRGILLSVDDFGTGYSSLSYLKKLPVSIVKVDRSFVKDIPQDREDMEITAAIVAMTHRLNYRVVAEGIETLEQLSFLRECGCDMGQGYLISRPLPADALEEFCLDWRGQRLDNRRFH